MSSESASSMWTIVSTEIRTPLRLIERSYSNALMFMEMCIKAKPCIGALDSVYQLSPKETEYKLWTRWDPPKPLCIGP